MKSISLISVLILFLFSSCKKAEIIPDPVNPDLPSYSEKGLNVGGILINNNPWTTHPLSLFSTVRPLQIISNPSGDSITVLLNGTYKNLNLQNQPPSTIFVVLKNIKIITDNDLLKLNSKNFVLDGNINYGGFSSSYGYDKIGKATGAITFGKVSEITNITYGDGSPNNPILHPYIVAGQLSMNFTTTSNYSLTNGRFDVTIVRSSNQFSVY